MYPNNQGGDSHIKKENPVYRNNKENNILRKKQMERYSLLLNRMTQLIKTSVLSNLVYKCEM